MISIIKMEYKMQKEPMTEYGYEKVVAELKHFKEIERPNIVKEIDIARGHGDLKENAEYHAAKEKQLFIEAKIKELTELISCIHVLDPSTLKHDKIGFGSTFEILDIKNDKNITYTIVGSTESNPEKGLISFNSPLAKAFLGKEEGDEVILKLPNGEMEYEVLNVGFKAITFH